MGKSGLFSQTSSEFLALGPSLSWVFTLHRGAVRFLGVVIYNPTAGPTMLVRFPEEGLTQT